MVYVIVLYGDLANDLINPIEFCAVVNRIMPWENMGHALLILLLLFHKNYFAVVLNLPLLTIYLLRFRSDDYFLDNTKIFVDMNRERRICEFKLGFYLILFFVVLYLFIQFLIS